MSTSSREHVIIIFKRIHYHSADSVVCLCFCCCSRICLGIFHYKTGVFCTFSVYFVCVFFSVLLSPSSTMSSTMLLLLRPLLLFLYNYWELLFILVFFRSSLAVVCLFWFVMVYSHMGQIALFSSISLYFTCGISIYRPVSFALSVHILRRWKKFPLKFGNIFEDLQMHCEIIVTRK